MSLCICLQPTSVSHRGVLAKHTFSRFLWHYTWWLHTLHSLAPIYVFYGLSCTLFSVSWHNAHCHNDGQCFSVGLCIGLCLSLAPSPVHLCQKTMFVWCPLLCVMFFFIVYVFILFKLCCKDCGTWCPAAAVGYRDENIQQLSTGEGTSMSIRLGGAEG